MPREELPLTAQEQVYRALLLKWVKEAWEDRTAGSVAEFFHPDCVVTGMTPEIVEGLDQLQAAYQVLHSRVEHNHAEVSFVTVRDKQFSLVMSLQGTHRESNLDVVIEVGVFGRIKDHLIFQVHNVVDYSSMYAKLGMLDVEKIRTQFG